MLKRERGSNEYAPSRSKEKLLLAAFEVSKGNTEKIFTGEDLLVEAWEQDRQAWGLRGYEMHHPDLEKLRKEIDSRGKSMAPRV